MKIALTKDQAASIITACEWAIDDNFSMSDPINQHYQRIINKLEKAIREN